MTQPLPPPKWIKSPLGLWHLHTKTSDFPLMCNIPPSLEIQIRRESVLARERAIKERLNCIRRDLDELRIPACSLLGVEVWNLMRELEEKE